MAYAQIPWFLLNPMHAPHILAALLAYLEHRNATQEQSRNFIAYWTSASRDQSVPCPICYTFRGRHSGLAALHVQDGFEPLVCNSCGETFNVPLQ